ncbi:hypothetical protein HG536_0D03250 [Torulaspora globosa]|uniref:C2H2-type domain-containing protein n=1 Tax=Torulaspora globosa TaxID=48254 RepID=A0A7G3ZH17_9SACH|nr:uncharacterized protein HG536_0D03250 [Torulaspora globosa]QLL32803.1 hypothetical protein HG536_0D03250 [Torulaspora globosa]
MNGDTEKDKNLVVGSSGSEDPHSMVGGANGGGQRAGGEAGKQARQDSISMFTNFGQPRFSTDASISSFLNISERPSISGPNDLSQIGRGFSIVNNLWSNQPAVPPSAQQQQPQQQFNTIRRQSETLEPFMPPRFRNPTFSSKSGAPQQQQSQQNSQQQQQQQYRQQQPSSNRNSIYFGPNEPPDLEFFHPANLSSAQQGKRESSVNPMKPPMLVPLSGGTSTPPLKYNNPPASASQSAAGTQQPQDFDTLFASNNAGSLLGSRNNSLKFNPEDFDFQFKRRDSSVRATLDNQRYNVGNQSPGTMSNNEVVVEGTSPNEPEVKRQKRSSKEHLSDLITNPTHDALSKLPNSILDPTDATTLEDSKPLLGVTKVDQLMLMIQARKKGVTEKVPTTADGRLLIDENSNILPPSNQLVGGVEKPKGSHGVKQHECPYCHRFFTQSTHLEVHVRSHIGYKPFQCEYCGKRFTQGGNLRTHQRLHTGEKPYECELCGKRFSRKGNLAAHIVTHQKLKPFICKLDGCNKTFTQLGNMKAHQNRFHLNTLNELTQKLAEMDPNENMAPKERELLDYFASLYKNSNKGIKGRGKGSTRVTQTDLRQQQQVPPHTMAIPSKSQFENPLAAREIGSMKTQQLPQQQASQQQNSPQLELKNDAVINYGYPTIPQANQTNSDPKTAALPLTNPSSASSVTNTGFTFSLDQPDKLDDSADDSRNTSKGQVQFKNVNYKG